MNNPTEFVSTQFFHFSNQDLPFRLRSGETLNQVTLAYEMYGELNARKDNAILLFHALTGSQHAAGKNPSVKGLEVTWNEECQTGWWDGFIGFDKAIDLHKYCVICVNYIGGCYGSTGPTSICPETNKFYGADFPQVTFSDIVDSQMKFIDHLGIDKLHAVIGASIGGMMCLSTATRYPDRICNVVPIGSGVDVSPLQRILNLEQIYAIESDPDFQGGAYLKHEQPARGMAFARMISHKTFVSLTTMEHRARGEISADDGNLEWYKIGTSLESYMLYQGRKFIPRFDANSYLRILDAWQNFDLLNEAKAESFQELFSRCQRQKYLVFSIDSDVCFYPESQQNMVNLLRGSDVPTTWVTVNSEKGHDAFLVEPDLFAPHLLYTLNGNH